MKLSFENLAVKQKVWLVTDVRGSVYGNVCLNQKHCLSSITMYGMQVLDYIVKVSLLGYQI